MRIISRHRRSVKRERHPAVKLGCRGHPLDMDPECRGRELTMLESIIPVVMAGVFAFLVQPPIAEVGVYAGPYWPEAGDSELIRTTTGVTAYTPLSDHLGVEFGAAYTQSGYAWHCPWPCFDWNKPRDEGRTLRDYIDASALVQARIPATDRASLRLCSGPPGAHRSDAGRRT